MINKKILRALIGAGLIIAMALGLKSLAASDVIDGETSTRVMQVIIGIFLMVSGNSIPKVMEPLSDEREYAKHGEPFECEEDLAPRAPV